jgi:hypothetical protein
MTAQSPLAPDRPAGQNAGMSEEEDYDDLVGPRAPSLRAVLRTNSVSLVVVGVFLMFISFGSSAVTVGPEGEFWRTVITAVSAVSAIAAFISAGVVWPRAAP